MSQTVNTSIAPAVAQGDVRDVITGGIGGGLGGLGGLGGNGLGASNVGSSNGNNVDTRPLTAGMRRCTLTDLSTIASFLLRQVSVKRGEEGEKRRL